VLFSVSFGAAFVGVPDGAAVPVALTGGVAAAAPDVGTVLGVAGVLGLTGVVVCAGCDWPARGVGDAAWPTDAPQAVAVSRTATPQHASSRPEEALVELGRCSIGSPARGRGGTVTCSHAPGMLTVASGYAAELLRPGTGRDTRGARPGVGPGGVGPV
jgi:hypothetical protein